MEIKKGLLFGMKAEGGQETQLNSQQKVGMNNFSEGKDHHLYSFKFSLFSCCQYNRADTDPKVAVLKLIQEYSGEAYGGVPRGQDFCCPRPQVS